MISPTLLKTRMDVFNTLIIHQKAGETDKDIAKRAIVIADALVNYDEDKEIDRALKIA